MALSKCNANVSNISALPDEPTTTATALKALMDKAGVDIKNYLNNVLTNEQDAVNALISGVSKAQIDTLAGIDTTSTIQGQLNAKQRTVAGIDDTKIGYLAGVTSDIQSQLNGKQAIVAGVDSVKIGYLSDVTGDIQAQLNTKQPVVSGVDSTEIGYLNGVTSAIQTQLNAKQSTIQHGTTLPAAGQAGRVFILHK